MSSDTQIAAYHAVKDKRSYWRNKLRKALEAHTEGLTTEQVCVAIQSGYDNVLPLRIDLNDIYKSLQPRTSEAHADCQIYDSGKRGLNSSGKKAIIWKLVTTPEEREIAIKQNIKKMKPIGDKKLFGEMMRAIYAYEAWECPANADKLEFGCITWALDMKNKIRKAKHAK